MTIEIHTPELEALIRQRMESGRFQNVDDLLMQALKSTPEKPLVEEPPSARKKSLVEVFAPLRGLDLDFSRNKSTGRAVEL